MSPLTKVFVVVHVILSILLTAALVVFVNRVEDFRAAKDQLSVQLATEKTALNNAVAAANAAQGRAVNDFQAAQAKLDTEKTRLAALMQQIADRDTQIASLLSDKSQATSSSTSATEALKASEAQKTELNKIIVELRKQSDDLTKKNSELQGQVSTLTANVESTTKEAKFLSEELVQSKASVEKLQSMVTKLDPNALKSGTAPTAPPAINAVVRSVKQIEGKTWATISVGAVDDVKKGMEFKLIDRERGLFLGLLTVDSVDDREATGFIEGPRVSEVRKDVEARTQL